MPKEGRCAAAPPGACRRPGRGPARRHRARGLHVRRPDHRPSPSRRQRLRVPVRPGPPTAPGSPSASPTMPYPSPASASGRRCRCTTSSSSGGTTPPAWRPTSPSSSSRRHVGRLRLASSPAAADRFAAVVAAAARHHIQLIVILEKPAPLLDLGTPADQQAYRTWVAQIVGRYRASVHYWEILSEPNLRYTWNIDSKHDSDPQAYCRGASLRHAAEARLPDRQGHRPDRDRALRRAVRGQGRALHAGGS